MWVAPEHRRHGVGRSLVESILEWARSRGVSTLCLTVTSNDDAATRFYERLGFAPTGKGGPYRSDPALSEFEMSRPISGPVASMYNRRNGPS
ncbi:MAG: GNAT family N-acetyltransferase [Candidatus Eisenbacteria bacterium]|nr:GNAT family N-acetyltransferase [Candidatus Eisenbacteria bacterium]